jgi:hypothetical protein
MAAPDPAGASSQTQSGFSTQHKQAANRKGRGLRDLYALAGSGPALLPSERTER